MSSSFLRCLEMLGDVLLVKARGRSPLASPRPGRGSSAVGSQESDQAGLVLKVLGVLTFWGFSSWVGQGSWRRLFCFPPEECGLNQERLRGHPKHSLCKCPLNFLSPNVLSSRDPLSSLAPGPLQDWEENLATEPLPKCSTSPPVPAPSSLTTMMTGAAHLHTSGAPACDSGCSFAF